MKYFEIIHEDDDLIIVNKQSGVLSIPDRHVPEKINLQDVLSRKRAIWTVHRLDKNTSGLICFAKNALTHKSLNEQFSKGEVKKKYLAIVEGNPSREGTIDAPIYFPPNGIKSTISEKGKRALTHFEKTEQFLHYALLELDIKTGRTHQIRVHLKHIQHPLVVDPLYGNRKEFFLSSIKRNYHRGKNQEERPLLTRTPLHAHSITFVHPGTGKTESYSAPPPKDFNAMLTQLRKWNGLS